MGLCCSAPSEGDTGGFLDLVRLRLPEGKVIDRVQVDVLPTSRPCWVPDRPGSIVFAAGDGQLYRHDFDDADDLDNSQGAGPAPGVPRLHFRPLVWNCPAPSSGTSYLTDPTWPAHPRLRHLVLATLICPPRQGDSKPGKGTRLWWLRMNPDDLTIDASGPLFDEADGIAASERIQRFPTVAVDRSGEIHLAYLTHNPGQIQGKIKTVRVQVDPQSGRPKVVSQTDVTVARDCATLPPVFSADGKTVFAISSPTGQLMKYPVEPVGQVRGRIAVAGKD